jgi:hypothetical protein
VLLRGVSRHALSAQTPVYGILAGHQTSSLKNRLFFLIGCLPELWLPCNVLFLPPLELLHIHDYQGLDDRGADSWGLWQECDAFESHVYDACAIHDHHSLFFECRAQRRRFQSLHSLQPTIW